MANSKALRIKNSDVEIAQNPQTLNFTGGLVSSYDGVGNVDVELASNGVTITNDSTENTISIDQNGNVGTDVVTDGALHVENTDNTGIGLAVYSNLGATADAPLVHIKADNAAFDQECLKIEQDGVQTVLRITAASTTRGNSQHAVIIDDNGGSSASAALYIDDENPNTNWATFYLQSERLSGGRAVTIDMNGAGNAIYIDHDDNGSNASIEIDRDGNNASDIIGITIDLQNAGAGAAQAFHALPIQFFAARLRLIWYLSHHSFPCSSPFWIKYYSIWYM